MKQSETERDRLRRDQLYIGAAAMPLAVQRATAADGPTIVALRDHLARWQQRHGIDQWKPGELNVRLIEIEADAGQWFVVRDRQAMVATARVTNADPHTWGARGQDGRAGYLHGLMVHRDFAGQGVGSAVLAWVEQFVTDCGRDSVRLDWLAHNRALRAYYRRHGDLDRGVNDFGGDRQWRPVARFEKPLEQLPGSGGPAG